MKKPKVSVVTLTYNGLKVLKPCVESVLTHCKGDYEWIIRENGSTDGSLDYLKTLEPEVPVKVVMAENKGNFASMNNELLPDCDGEYLLFLNNDITCSNDFITPMAEYLADPTIGSVGAVLRYPNGLMQHCGIIFHEGQAHNLSSSFAKTHGIDINTVISKDRLYQVATAACVMVRKEDFLKVGGFDTNFHWCYDDVDLGLKITHQLGKPAVVPAKVQLVHHESWSNAKPTPYEALRLLRKKHKDVMTDDYWQYVMDSYNVYTKV